MENTPYIEECCTILETTKQYSSDVHLVQMVRLQITVGKIRRNVPSFCGIDAPIAMYMNSLQAELQILRERLRMDDVQNRKPYTLPPCITLLTTNLSPDSKNYSSLAFTAHNALSLKSDSTLHLLT
jgi:hypothetical protein